MGRKAGLYPYTSEFGPGSYVPEGVRSWTQPEGKIPLPPGYEVEHGADVLLLRRGDGSVAATFSARGVIPAQVANTAEEDQRRNRRRTD